MAATRPDPKGRRWVAALCDHPILTLAAAAILLLLPSLVLGINENDSAKYNYVWASQIFELVRHGELYPRWLGGSFDGLGSPSFYFYPPLAFFLDSLIGLITFDILPVQYRLPVTSLVLMLISGITMRAWLATTISRSPDARPIVLFAALAYMAAPYHLVDHYMRGAIAEFACYAMLPLALLGVRAAARGGRMGVALLAIGMAGIILAHLPTALLASVTILPLACLFEATQAASRRLMLAGLARCAAGAALGGCLAAGYLVPALMLQPAIAADQLWTPFFQVQNWFLLAPHEWPRPRFMWLISALAAASLVITAGVLLLSRRVAEGRRLTAIFWAAMGLLCLGLMAGLAPQFWTQMPFVAKVQFPWRIMMLVEFAMITAMALAWGQTSWRGLAVTLAVALVVSLPGWFLIAKGTTKSIIDSLGHWRAFQQEADTLRMDATEYLPSGFPLPDPGREPSPGPAALPLGPLADCPPPVSMCMAIPGGEDGSLRLHVISAQPADIVLRRFYFPAWRAELADGTRLATQAAGPMRELAIQAPAGDHDIRIAIAPTPSEQAGWRISAIALCLTLVLAIPRQRRRWWGG
jgi:hypothetical protein